MGLRARHLCELLATIAVLALALAGGAQAAEAPVQETGGAAEAASEVLVTTTPEPTTAPGSAEATTAPESSGEAEATTPPEVQSQSPQGTSEGEAAPAGPSSKNKAAAKEAEAEVQAGEGQAVKRGHKAPAPGTLTPALPFSLREPISGVPSFFIESFQIPPFLLPIFQAAGTAYDIPWQVLAAINEVETDYGRDLSISSAGAEGWMQFLPAEWARYGVDANGDGYRDPYNPADAIFAAARYLHAAGGAQNIRAAVFSYNHSSAYVESVMLRAQLLGATPSELLGAITGLTEARFPVHAAAHYSDGFPTVGAGASTRTVPGTTIYAAAGAPVIAVQDGEVVQTGDSPTLGHFVSLRDAYGNTYVYGDLGEVSSVYPVLQPHVNSTPNPEATAGAQGSEAAPTGPATAGAQDRSPMSATGTVSSLALGATAGLEGTPQSSPVGPATTTTTPAPVAQAEAGAVEGSEAEAGAAESGVAQEASPHPVAPGVSEFREGAENVYLHQLAVGSQVIAGTVLGHVGAGEGVTGSHMIFQIRPAGAGSPLIDPKPILDGWVALESSSVFHARGENPFLATSPTVGQVLLESKAQLQAQVLRDSGISLGTCGRQDVQSGRVDPRVLAALEYLSVSGLKPTVGGLACAPTTTAAQAANAGADANADAVSITAVNGVAVAGDEQPGSPADQAVHKLLMLQGLSRPRRIVSSMSYPGAAVTTTSSSATAIEVRFAASSDRVAGIAGAGGSTLSPEGWVRLIDRLGEIPDPSVSAKPSSAALPDQTQAGSDGDN